MHLSSYLLFAYDLYIFLIRVNPYVLKMASIGALLDHIVREKALSDCDDEGIGALDIRNIEILAMYDIFLSWGDQLMLL